MKAVALITLMPIVLGFNVSWIFMPNGELWWKVLSVLLWNMMPMEVPKLLQMKINIWMPPKPQRVPPQRLLLGKSSPTGWYNNLTVLLGNLRMETLQFIRVLNLLSIDPMLELLYPNGRILPKDRKQILFLCKIQLHAIQLLLIIPILRFTMPLTPSDSKPCIKTWRNPLLPI